MRVRILRDEYLCRGRRVKLISRVIDIEGKIVRKDVVRFGEAVAIVPIKDDGNIVMIKQFRVPVNDWVYEVPAGRVEEGENPEETARRELVEEVGYEAGELVRIASIYTAPGYSDEVLHIFIARKLRFVGSKPELGEVIIPIEVSLSKALDLVLNSKVADAKTLVALLLIKNLKI